MECATSVDNGVRERRWSRIGLNRCGDCWDNAVAESFWATLKAELQQDLAGASRSEARRILFEYIESFYNLRRRHSSSGNYSPRDYELLYFATAVTP